MGEGSNYKKNEGKQNMFIVKKNIFLLLNLHANGWNISWFFFVGLTLLSLLLPVLVSFLVDENKYASVSKTTQAIHDDCLNRLVKIGPMYPEQFKTIMTSNADLKLKLGLAIKHSQTVASSQKKTEMAANRQKLNQPAKPTIALKTNFGNFAASWHCFVLLLIKLW